MGSEIIFLEVSPFFPITNFIAHFLRIHLIHFDRSADGPVVIILATGSEVRSFKPGRSRWIFSERKNPEYDYLRKGSKAVGLVS